MLNETFYLDGVDARSVGIHLQAPLTFSEAVPVFEAQTIPGRNGDLIWETGSYENRSGSAVCFCLKKDVEKDVSLAGRFLMGKKGYRRLETSDDPDHYWMARVENSPQIAMRLRTLAPFEISFDCKPQRFLKSGDVSMYFTKTGFSLYNICGQTALPKITVYGNGAGRLIVGETVVEIKNLDGLLHLDSETQNAYNDFINLNNSINAPKFPVFNPGEIPIEFDGGISSIMIIPRWWEI